MGLGSSIRLPYDRGKALGWPHERVVHHIMEFIYMRSITPVYGMEFPSGLQSLG